MSETTNPAEWYYVGHYGQLGPLTLDQMEELVRDSVIDGDTYVWRPGLANWQPALGVPELQRHLPHSATHSPPPVPTPGGPPARTASNPPALGSQPTQGFSDYADYASYTDYSKVAASPSLAQRSVAWMPTANLPRSDKKRLTAGLLNFIPGFGRFYLGYSAHGALQLITSMCGFGYLWSVLDAFYILSGGLKYDGYGRVLDE